MSRNFGDAAARLSSAASLMVGWRPSEFWNATPTELALAISSAEPAGAPDASVIEALRRRFPDDKKA